MKMNRRILTALQFLMLFSATQCFAQTFGPGPEDEVNAMFEPTKRAVFLIDKGDVGTAWDEASKILQDRTSRLIFISVLKGMRATAGEVKSRKFKDIGFLQDMPNAPRGRYAAAFFDTDFSRVKAEEKLVFYKDGTHWRLAGYFLSKRQVATGHDTK